MTKNEAIFKIKKCLALAKSDNANESAIALKQARKLMDEYQVSAADVSLADIVTVVGGVTPRKPPKWEAYLLNSISQYMQVDFYLARRAFGEVRVNFIGLDPKPTIAEHAHGIVLRQIKRDRRNYIKSNLKRCKPANKTARADEYCTAWVYSLRDKLGEFAGISEHEESLIAAKKEHENLDLQPSKITDRKSGNDKDRVNGFVDGKKATLNHGMSQRDSGRYLA